MYKYYISNIKQSSAGKSRRLKKDEDKASSDIDSISSRVDWAKRVLDPNSINFLFPDRIPRIPIFYGLITTAEIRRKEWGALSTRPVAEASAFVRVADESEQWSRTRIVVISEGLVWILQPSGGIEEFSHEQIADIPKKDLAKTMRVNILQVIEQKNVPLLLGSLRVNRWFSSGTFTEIGEGYLPHKLAIEACMNPNSQYAIGALLSSKLIDIHALSSTELEGLVARILEESGCFTASRVPGSMQTIDVIAENDTTDIIDLNGVCVKPGEAISIQVKQGKFKPSKNELRQVDYFVITGNESSNLENGILGLDWLLASLETAPLTKKWLNRSVRWLARLRSQGA